jgi:hypothetical protein
MSALLVALLSGFALMLGSFAVHVGDAATARGRAQAAADAAALAGVAESAPYGHNIPELVARRYAELNGGELMSCLCRPGDTAVQVMVAAGGATARARAVIDPSAFAPAAIEPTTTLHPALAAAVDALVRASGGRIYIVSGVRSTGHQARLWAAALERYGSPEAADDWVAPPGRSLHERGLAVDLGGDLALAARLVSQLGLPLHRPLDNEPWHFELTGSRR